MNTITQLNRMRQAAIWGFWEVNSSNELDVFKRPEFDVPQTSGEFAIFTSRIPQIENKAAMHPKPNTGWGLRLRQTELQESPCSGLRSETGKA